MHMSKNNIFKENFQRYIDGFYSKNELESILKQIKITVPMKILIN